MTIFTHVLGKPQAIKTKKDIIRLIRPLLDVAGCITPWEDVEKELSNLSLRVLGTLYYRMERARAEAYAEGEQAATRM